MSVDGLVTVEVTLRAVMRIPDNVNRGLKFGSDHFLELWQMDLANRLGATTVAVDVVTEEVVAAPAKWRKMTAKRKAEIEAQVAAMSEAEVRRIALSVIR